MMPEKAGIDADKAIVLQPLAHLTRKVFVVIEEVDLDSWGWKGVPVAELRRRSSQE